jgi:CRP-like cAMP-binding protein
MQTVGDGEYRAGGQSTGHSVALGPDYCRGADDDELPSIGVTRFGANASIVRAGEPQHLVHVILSGWAYRAAQLENGRRQILTFLIPGDLVDIEALISPEAPAHFSVRSLTDIELRSYPAAPLRALAMGDPDRRRAYESDVRSHLAGMGHRLVDIGQRGAPGRLARLLVELHDRQAARGAAEAGAFDLPANQDQIADALGITSVHVNRTLRGFRNAGLVEIERKRARILDRSALERVAQDH